MGFFKSPFRDFESYHEILTGLDYDDIQIISQQYFSKINTYETFPGIYLNKNFTEVLSSGFKSEIGIREKMRLIVEYDRLNSIIIEYDDFAMRTKLIVRAYILALRFDQKSFLVVS